MEARPVPKETFYSTKLAQLEHFPGKGFALVILKLSLVLWWGFFGFFFFFFSKCYLILYTLWSK